MLLKTIEQNKKLLPKTHEVIRAGKIVQNWNPPLPLRADGSPYSYVDITTMDHADASKLGDAGKILGYKMEFTDALLTLKCYLCQKINQKYLDNSRL